MVAYAAGDCRLDDLLAAMAPEPTLGQYPHAAAIESGALVYHWPTTARVTADPVQRGEVLAEMAHALGPDGTGIVVLQQAVDVAAVDAASAAFRSLIAQQHASGAVAGDHFAKPGANDRVWNALEKLAVLEPDVFADYYASEAIALVSEAWLGPWYQVTSQVNVVNPGGQAQSPHRDYHLGFLSDEQAERFPAHVHLLSPALTLQGAVAHCDMPVESGPTLYLPRSHRYAQGYLAWRRPEFIEYFDRHHVQLPLVKGDAVFFNPALFHAAGTNRTADVRRMANLLQVSSAMGRAMETIDRERMCLALYPVLLQRVSVHGVDQHVRRVVAASAEGYAFPTNLDRDPPVDGLAPSTQADLMLDCLEQRRDPHTFAELLTAHSLRRRTTG
ncbi:MAG: hypothetical protein RI900_2237 [Actinomycetota bacterium]